MEPCWTRSPETEADQPPVVLVVGYGNTLRRDDGAGVAAAARLADALPPAWLNDQRVRVVTCHQLLPDLCEDLAAASHAVFIDAAVDLPPGQVRCQHIAAAAASPAAGLHTLSPRTLLGIAAALYGSAPQASLWSVGAADLDLGEGLSPVVCQSVNHLVSRVIADIHAAFAGTHEREITHA
jgi:hydrogenase maturation protease